MITSERPTLFELLPAVYKVRDAQQGGPLEALLSVMEQEVQLLEGDIERLYDNWFIETCDEWAVPYIGDLLGVSGVVPLDAGFSQRGLVANTIGYRRAKGTVAVLEQLGRDVTGWPSKAVEYFQLLAATRSMNHERHSDEAFFGVRDAGRAELAGTPFDPGLHTADVRHIDVRRGRHNISNVGIHLWRLQPYALSRVSALKVSDSSRWRVDPLGRDLHLFNVPPPERRLSQLAGEVNVPTPLRRRPLHDELEALRQSEAERRAAAAQNLAPASLRGALQTIDPDRWFDDSQPVVRVFARKLGNRAMEEIPREEIVICNLSGDPADGGWHRPSTPRTYTSRIGGTAQTVELDVTVGVDPVLGRLAFAKPIDPSAAETVYEAAEVSYAYGFPGDLGGGPYGRRESVAHALGRGPKEIFQRGVTGDPEVDDPGVVVPDLETALGDWNYYLDHFELDPEDPDARPFGVIALMDSRSYGEEGVALEVRVPNGCRLLIVAAGWPEFEADAEHDRVRTEGFLTPEDVRPHVRARFEVDGSIGKWPQLGPGELIVDGVLLGAGLEVLPGDLGRLRLAHCTLVPGSAGLTISTEDQDGMRNSALEFELERSICGALALPATVRAVRIAESVVDAADAELAIDASEVTLGVEASTVLGETRSRTLEASNSIFTGLVTVERRQTGCVRYSYLPPGSSVPRPYRCQPREDGPRGIAPTFNAAAFGEPDYAQLGRDCPSEIAEGADDEAEMGAFHFLMQPQRLRNLTTRLDEYLRFGLEAGVFFVT